MATAEAASFAENYRILQRCVADLRSAGAEDVDKLVDVVARAAAAHTACRERLDAVAAAVSRFVVDEGPA